MNKTELTAALAKKANLTKTQAGEIVNALFDSEGIIADSLRKGDAVTIPGFGSFAVSESKAREGRNPQTGKAIKIAARKRPVFRAGKGLKDVLK
jgi:DNA-binding protein HU-beta